MNSQETILSLTGDLTSNYAIAYLMADELYNAIEFGDLTTQGTLSSNFILAASTFISSFVIDSYGPITITFNPSALNLPKKINRIVYNFDDGTPSITNSFYYSLTSSDTSNYPYPNEPGDPRNFKVTKKFTTDKYFKKTFNVYIDVYQNGVYDPSRILYTINVKSPEMDGLNDDGSLFLEEMHLISTRMFGVDDDILYVFETKNPNYIIPFVLNWEKSSESYIEISDEKIKLQRPYKLLQPWEIENINNDHIKNINGVESKNTKDYINITEPPTYILQRSASNINEGSSVTFTLNTTNVTNGTLVPYIITGITSNDLSAGSLTGNFNINNNTASVSITLANDLLTEDTETATLTLNNGQASISVTINDTSTSPIPTYVLQRSASNINEGSSVTFTLNTTNVTNGTLVPYTITGITSSDLSAGSLTGNFNINNNTASVSITLANDLLTEGTETATLTLNNGQASISVTINDTSTSPIIPKSYNLRLSSENMNQLYISEGSTVTYILSTTNVTNGTLVPYTITGITSSDLSAGSLTGNFNINNNLSNTVISLSGDQLTEGNKIVTLTLNNILTSISFTLLDTSLNPPLKILFTAWN